MHFTYSSEDKYQQQIEIDLVQFTNDAILHLSDRSKDLVEPSSLRKLITHIKDDEWSVKPEFINESIMDWYEMCQENEVRCYKINDLNRMEYVGK